MKIRSDIYEEYMKKNEELTQKNGELWNLSDDEFWGLEGDRIKEDIERLIGYTNALKWVLEKK